MVRKGCDNGRVRLSHSAQRYLWARSAAHCANPDCRLYLFADAGAAKIDFGELAHIIAASEVGPRADARLPGIRRADADNIVLLCSNCHTVVDKAPHFHTVEMLHEWQRRHMVAVEGLFGAIEYPSRALAAEATQGLLTENGAVFRSYGPALTEREGKYGKEWARQWRRKVREIILPNNRRLLTIYDKNKHLMIRDESDSVELFRQHVDDLEARHFRGEVEPGSIRFPVSIEKVFHG